VNKRQITLFLFVQVILPMFVGGLIYITWRSDRLTMFEWFHLIGIDETIQTWRTLFLPTREYLPNVLLYSGPDGAWVYSMTAFFSLIWANTRTLAAFLWTHLAFTLGLGSELLRLFDFVPGTFDILDAVFYTLAWLVSLVSSRLILKRYSDTKN
jgi:hypothetical protein